MGRTNGRFVKRQDRGDLVLGFRIQSQVACIPVEELCCDFKNDFGGFRRRRRPAQAITQLAERSLLLLGPLQITDISRNRYQADYPALVVPDGRSAQRDRELGSIFFAIEQFTLPSATQSVLENLLAKPGGTLRRVENSRRLPEDFLQTVAVGLPKRTVGEREAILVVPGANQLGGALQRVGSSRSCSSARLRSVMSMMVPTNPATLPSASWKVALLKTTFRREPSA